MTGESTKRIRETLRRDRNQKKGLTRPMDSASERVAEILRRDVTKPGHLPVGNPLRFDGVYVKRRSSYGRVADVDGGWPCPMGLHPESRGRDEPCGIPFGPDGEAFSAWWDEQEDAQAAVDAVWGKV